MPFRSPAGSYISVEHVYERPASKLGLAKLAIGDIFAYSKQIGAKPMRKIGAVIFPGFELLDLFGPLQMFGMMKERFELTLVAEDFGPVQSNQGVAAVAEKRFADGVKYDLLFVPGGAGTRREVANATLLNWIALASAHSEYTLGVCTGSALLAKAGVLDGKRATTNKAAFEWVAEQGQRVNWVRKARWVEDGKYITSSGVSAGTDMALGAIALMHGVQTAQKVATWAEYSWHCSKDNDPFARV